MVFVQLEVVTSGDGQRGLLKESLASTSIKPNSILYM